MTSDIQIGKDKCFRIAAVQSTLNTERNFMNEKLSGKGHLAVSVDVKGPTCLDPGCRQLPWECPGLPVRFFPGQIRTVASVCVHLHCALYIEKTFQSNWPVC